VLTGADLDRWDDEAFQAISQKCACVCACLAAAQGQIVEALKANGEIVAMTGDG